MQATRSPKQSGRPDKHHEPSPQRRPEPRPPGGGDKDGGRHPDTPRRPGEDKQRDVRTPPGHR